MWLTKYLAIVFAKVFGRPFPDDPATFIDSLVFYIPIHKYIISIISIISMIHYKYIILLLFVYGEYTSCICGDEVLRTGRPFAP